MRASGNDIPRCVSGAPLCRVSRGVRVETQVSSVTRNGAKLKPRLRAEFAQGRDARRVSTETSWVRAAARPTTILPQNFDAFASFFMYRPLRVCGSRVWMQALCPCTNQSAPRISITQSIHSSTVFEWQTKLNQPISQSIDIWFNFSI